MRWKPSGRTWIRNLRRPGSNQGNTQNEKAFCYQSFIDLRCYLELARFEPRPQFAVHAVRLWHDKMGRERYPHADKIKITADCGGSNGPRLRLWKLELQALADAS